MINNISVIIPILNEEAGLPFLVSSLNNYFKKNKDIKAEIIFVDDGSTDSSVFALKKLNHIYYKSKIIRLSKNYGSHAAIRAGIKISSSPVVTFISSDLQDPLSLIGKMLVELRKGYDVVWAERKSIDNGFITNAFTKMYAKLMRLFVFSNFPENGFDVVMFNQKIKKELNENIEPNSSIILQIMSLGFKSTTVSYDKSPRRVGVSKWTLAKKNKLLIDSFFGFSYSPIRYITITGVVISLFGFFWAVYVLFRALFEGISSPGWPSLIAILTIGFGITNISLGILSEYLWRSFDVARRRKVFIIDNIIDLKSGYETK